MYVDCKKQTQYFFPLVLLQVQKRQNSRSHIQNKNCTPVANNLPFYFKNFCFFFSFSSVLIQSFWHSPNFKSKIKPRCCSNISSLIFISIVLQIFILCSRADSHSVQSANLFKSLGQQIFLNTAKLSWKHRKGHTTIRVASTFWLQSFIPKWL